MASDLVEKIANAGSKYECMLHRDLLLAGRCLADDVAVDYPLKDHILEGLFKLFWDGEYRILRSQAGEVLFAMRGSDYEKRVADSFISAMGDKESSVVRYRAASALGRLGTASEEVIHAFIGAMGEDKDMNVRYRAAEALGRLGTASEDVIDALIKALIPQVILPTGVLIKALGDEKLDVRKSAADALGQRRDASGDVVDALIKALSDEDSDVRRSAVGALGRLGAASEDVIESHECDDRYRAARTLDSPGTTYEDVIEAFIKAMGSEGNVVRSRAASALGRLGTASEEVIHALISAMGDKESYGVRSSAASALGRLGGGSKEVMDALLGRLRVETDPRVADAIFDAVSSLAAAEAGGTGDEK